MKPHRGMIVEWTKIPCSLGIGYYVNGISIDHPQFGGAVMRTSYVVSEEGNEIETRNSRYTLADLQDLFKKSKKDRAGSSIV